MIGGLYTKYGLARSATRRQAPKKFDVELAGMALACFATNRFISFNISFLFCARADLCALVNALCFNRDIRESSDETGKIERVSL
jgi:hypothetical protein